MAGILIQPFLQHRAEILLEGFKILDILGLGFQFRKHTVDQRLADFLQHRRGLQDLTADIQRQVLGIHHADHEGQPVRQQVGGIRNKHALNMQPHLGVTGLLNRHERLFRGDEQQRAELQRAFGAPMDGGPGLIEGMAEMAIETGVILRGNFRLRAPPECRAFGHRVEFAVFLKLNRQRDVIRPFADDGLDSQRFEIFLGIRLDVQNDRGARLLARGGFQRINTAPGRMPRPGLIRARFAGNHFHGIGHHEGGIEPDAELPDQAGPVLGLLPGQAGGEGRCARARNGAEIFRQLLLGHADAMIGNGDGLRMFIERDADGGTFRQSHGLVREGEEPPFIGRVRRIGHQLAQKYLAIRIKRMYHEIEQAADLGTKIAGLFSGILFGHAILVIRPELSAD